MVFFFKQYCYFFLLLATFDAGYVFYLYFAAVVKWERMQDLVHEVLSYLDVVTLVEKKIVSSKWKTACTNAINQKSIERKAFKTNDELQKAVVKYAMYTPDDDATYADYAEELATTYGWPIDKWDVSNLQDFSSIFGGQRSFNEDISSWDVSNATKMNYMFDYAARFNQDVSYWDTSNVTNMENMFCGASAFNQNISSWDTSAVTDMDFMFRGAVAFNQDMSSWDASSVTEMNYMFWGATAFNQDLSSWDTSNVMGSYHMFNNEFSQAKKPHMHS